jgi:ribonuclease HII
MIVGIDEAGRGPLAGSVVACALYLKNDPPFTVRDSKILSAKQREDIFSWLSVHTDFAIAYATAKEIDELNILGATLLTFNRAVESLLKKSPYLKKAEFIVDGTHFKNELGLNVRCVPGADKSVKEVSCASIMAKVFRDYLMRSVDFLYPQWNFRQNKGYPTKEHFSLIETNELSDLHRRSFAPCRQKLSLSKSVEK